MSMLPPAAGLGLPDEFRINPYPFYERLREAGPVLWMPGFLGRGAWFVTSHHECSAILKDNRFGKEADKVLSPEEMAQGPALMRRANLPNMLFRDPPTHTRLRGLVNQAFTPRMLERLRPHIQEIAESLIAGWAGRSEVDLISEFAFPLPIIVIAELLGVPASDRAQFKAWSNPLAATTDPTATPEMVAEAMRILPEFTEYMRQIIEERRQHLGADLISMLIQAHDAGDKLSTEELLATCRLLLVAGHETTVNLIGNGTLALLRHPEQRQWLAAHPDQIVGAVEELLRYDSPVQLTVRTAFEDVHVSGHPVKRGDLVVTLLGAANRDPGVFADPAALDLARANAHSHIAFGQGIHYCLGAPLARMEGQIAIGSLLRLVPDMELAAAELRYRGNITLRGLQELPVRLG
jgi:cytochrome P450